jgi:hypothetical protein
MKLAVDLGTSYDFLHDRSTPTNPPSEYQCLLLEWASTKVVLARAGDTLTGQFIPVRIHTWGDIRGLDTV